MAHFHQMIVSLLVAGGLEQAGDGQHPPQIRILDAGKVLELGNVVIEGSEGVARLLEVSGRSVITPAEGDGADQHSRRCGDDDRCCDEERLRSARPRIRPVDGGPREVQAVA